MFYIWLIGLTLWLIYITWYTSKLNTIIADLQDATLKNLTRFSDSIDDYIEKLDELNGRLNDSE